MKKNRNAVIFATWVGMIVNALLTILKVIGGVLSGSRALIADALHSASDIVGSIVILVAVKIANKPPDEEHPYGHGKAESIASIIVALLLIVVGFEISLSSIKVFFGEIPKAPGKIALIIIIISIVIKEILFQYKFRLGKKYQSAALITEAWHHRSDSLSSLAALIGISVAIIGQYYGLKLLVYGDAVAGLIVSLIVIKVGYSLAKESANVALEQVLTDEETEKYVVAVQSVNGVINVDEILARTHGSYIVIDLKIAVDANITVKEGHEIGQRTKQLLMETYEEIEDILVHINPR